jgi:hypothetical protein
MIPIAASAKLSSMKSGSNSKLSERIEKLERFQDQIEKEIIEINIQN